MRLPLFVPPALAGLTLVAAFALVPALAQSPPQPPSTQTPPAPQASPAPADAPSAPRAETPPSAPLSWVSKGVAELRVLDKVNARHTDLTVKAGDKVQLGPLTIEVQACVVRPPNEPQDAAAFLSITDANNDGVPFRGWMVASQPALSMLQHPMYDVRVTGCHA